MWTFRQRAVIFGLACCIFFYLLARLSLDRVTIGDPQPAQGSRANELADRFDVNTATQAELAAIPTIGEKLAAAVIEYRERFAKTHPGKRAFERPGDLMKVRGVGAAKMEVLSQHLLFPEGLSTSNPSSVR
jgi:DNA uptake protein ComE-like DNA-binding protein